jgi:hypothetical protein
MARNTRMKIAALATTLVATLGVVAFAPSAGADAGKTYSPTYRVGGGGESGYCC